MDCVALFARYQKMLCRCPSVGLTLDISRMRFKNGYLSGMKPALEAVFAAMDKLEAGKIANPDENRMVGHYWLRTPELAPTKTLAKEITATRDAVIAFARQVHRKQITPPRSPRFTDLLVIGIGGSALGPQLVADALGSKRDKLKPHFLDNTDPDGIIRTLADIGNRLKSTLVVVISKSGGTPETRNGMIETQRVFAARQLDFARQAVAITQEGSKLDQLAVKEGWLARFPMWDWVGGRTSVLSAVGLLPAALQGIDVMNLLKGAAAMDAVTRRPHPRRNPAALLALMWHYATNGRGAKDMVILPYKDRLLLFSRYLQQLVMESLGKEKDLDGKVVRQGLTVYGNKGSTDQHAYVQQLREGVHNFFATFIVVQQDLAKPTRKLPGLEGVHEVDPGVTSGDYLHGFYLGTRQALYENERDSMTLTIKRLDAKALGALIALYERAVGFYASLVNINAYHQPGVEAGKKAAVGVLELQKQVMEYLKKNAKKTHNPEMIAKALKQPEQTEMVMHILNHLAANDRGIAAVRKQFQWVG
jgi:glucose-6-phosphate isomerase